MFSVNSQIRVITKLPNSEQSYKGKVKTHNYKYKTDKISQNLLFKHVTRGSQMSLKDINRKSPDAF
jgi:hypothetical protein